MSGPSGRSSPTSACSPSSCGARCWARSWTGWASCGPCGSAPWLLAVGLWLYPVARVAVGLRRRHPPCADRDGAAVSIHYLSHVAPVRPPRAGHHDGRGPDVRRAGAGGRAAAGDRGVPAARPSAPVLHRRRLRGAGRCPGLPDPGASRHFLPTDGGGKSEGLMSTDDRLDRLERRVAALETLVRDGGAAGRRGSGAAAARAGAAHRQRRPRSVPRRRPSPPPRAPAPPTAAPRPRRLRSRPASMSAGSASAASSPSASSPS